MAFSVRLDTPARVSADLSASGRTLLTEWFLGLKEPPTTIGIGLAAEKLSDADTGSVLDGKEVQSSYDVSAPWDAVDNPLGDQVDTLDTGYKRASYGFFGQNMWASQGNGVVCNTTRITICTVEDYWPAVRGWFLATPDNELFAYGGLDSLNASKRDTISIDARGLMLSVVPLLVN